MRQLRQPRVANTKDAVEHIMVMQSEQIVDDGKLRIAREALEFYATADEDDGGKIARRALEMTKP